MLIANDASKRTLAIEASISVSTFLHGACPPGLGALAAAHFHFHAHRARGPPLLGGLWLLSIVVASIG